MRSWASLQCKRRSISPLVLGAFLHLFRRSSFELTLLLTVYSLDPATPSHTIHSRVARTIADLGLSDVLNNYIGTPVQRGISGGQKRRVTLGAALVTRPRILILDEPTSGLDSRTSKEVLACSECSLLLPCNLALTSRAYSQRFCSQTRSNCDCHYPPAQLGDVCPFRQAPAARTWSNDVLRSLWYVHFPLRFLTHASHHCTRPLGHLPG